MMAAVSDILNIFISHILRRRKKTNLNELEWKKKN